MINLIDINNNAFDIAEDRLTETKTTIRDLCQQVLTAGQRQARAEAFAAAASLIREYADDNQIEPFIVFRKNSAGMSCLNGVDLLREIAERVEQEQSK